jgi:predicted dienelactone hydrolase
MDRVGVCGHGYGGRAAATVLGADPRVKAGVTLQAVAPDGARLPVGSEKPLLDIAAPRPGLGARATPADRSEAAHLNVVVAGAVHRSFSDADLLRGRFARQSRKKNAAPKVIDPSRAIEITCAYVVAFFDRHLRDGKNDLLDQSKPPFAEVELVR